MLTVKVEADAALAMLEAAPDNLRRALAAKLDALRARVESIVVDDKLSGNVLNDRSGALKQSIFSTLDESEGALTAIVGSAGVPYAAIQEFGGRTAPHDIFPNKAKALAFILGGSTRYAMVVHHPGSTIPRRSYLLSTLKDMKATILASLTTAAADAGAAS